MDNSVKEKEAERELLAEMYRNVTMGSENLAAVVSKISGKEMLTNVTSQLEKYADFTNRTEKLLKKQSVTPNKPSAMKKFMSRSGIMMNTMFDSSDGHIADMIVKGTRMGADQLEAKLNTLGSGIGNTETADLCREIVGYERREAVKMRGFT